MRQPSPRRAAPPVRTPVHVLRSAAAAALIAVTFFTAGVAADRAAASFGRPPTQLASAADAAPKPATTTSAKPTPPATRTASKATTKTASKPTRPAKPASTKIPAAPPVVIQVPVNFRDALATTPRAPLRAAKASPVLETGVLWRSGKLSKASAADRKVLTRILAGGTIIDLRTASVATASPDPKLTGVTRVAIPLSPSYGKFVSDSSSRKAVAAAIRTVAYAPGPVLIHCTYGRDRTGWTVAMIHSALGLPEAAVRAEYLKSSGATNAKLDRGLKQVRKDYGTIHSYLVDGLGLNNATLKALRAKLTA